MYNRGGTNCDRNVFKPESNVTKRSNKSVMKPTLPPRNRQLLTNNGRSIDTKVSNAISNKIRSSVDPCKPVSTTRSVVVDRASSSSNSFRSFGSPKPVHVSTRNKMVPAIPMVADKPKVPATKKPDDIDIKTKDDELYTTEYVQEMYERFRREETCTEPYLRKHYLIVNETTRSCMVDVIIHRHYKSPSLLSAESLYLTIDILDRFLARSIVGTADLELVCVSCLLIASKYEDIYPPLVEELVELSSNRHVTKGSIIDMETKILKALDYRISKPTSLVFLIRFSQAAHANQQVSQLASFLLEGTLLSYPLLCKYKPSELAAASVFLARRFTLGYSDWSVTLDKYAGYHEDQVINVARDLLSAQAVRRSRSEFSSVDEKYTKCFGGVATLNFPKKI